MPGFFQLPPGSGRGREGTRVLRSGRLRLVGLLLATVAVIAGMAGTRAFAADLQVTRVFDGETLEIDSGGKKIAVRLAGVDAPEPARFAGDEDQPFSVSARSLLATYTLNRVVDLREYGRDADGYLLAEVFVGDRNINLALVQAGLAEVVERPAAEDLNLAPYRRAEAEARSARRGMWMQERYISPAQWRRLHGG